MYLLSSDNMKSLLVAEIVPLDNVDLFIFSCYEYPPMITSSQSRSSKSDTGKSRKRGRDNHQDDMHKFQAFFDYARPFTRMEPHKVSILLS